MKFVAAKKDGETMTVASLWPGDVFRCLNNGDAVYSRLSNNPNGTVTSLVLDGRKLIVSMSGNQAVIPARVLLVEKGADIEEVRKALEEL